MALNLRDKTLYLNRKKCIEKRQSKILFLKNETWKLDLKEISRIIACRIFIVKYLFWARSNPYFSSEYNFHAISSWTFYSLSLSINKLIYLNKCSLRVFHTVFLEFSCLPFKTWLRKLHWWRCERFKLLHMVHYFNEEKTTAWTQSKNKNFLLEWPFHIEIILNISKEIIV